MPDLTISFPTQASLTEFATWLCEQGEQDYWTWMDEQDRAKTKTVDFEYHSPLDTKYPANDQRRYANAKFVNENKITTHLQDEPKR